MFQSLNVGSCSRLDNNMTKYERLYAPKWYVLPVPAIASLWKRTEQRGNVRCGNANRSRSEVPLDERTAGKLGEP
ncbi:hypothetical protein KPH14_004898 [Odynerus spinipes]|uniref:Uncharacterized protein n=1 Tax=Odynerus spinipes TaxID=1348599 RepID=A0AAD9RMY3_9HYME|nr:hypothetical protein KPH14_004898 [Odynerus spinipes]